MSHATLQFKNVAREDADSGVQAIYDRTQAGLGFIPNLYPQMANAPGLFETYIQGYTQFRTRSGLTPVEQEVVFLTISVSNRCEYCVAAHSVVADTMSKAPREVTDAIRNGAPIPDPRLRALSSFTNAMIAKRGRPDETDLQSFLQAGFTPEHVLQIILAIGVKLFSNYTNHIANTPLDAAFAGRKWQSPASCHTANCCGSGHHK